MKTAITVAASNAAPTATAAATTTAQSSSLSPTSTTATSTSVGADGGISSVKLKTEENTPEFTTPTGTATVAVSLSIAGAVGANKRPLSLDLKKPVGAKKQALSGITPLLDGGPINTPDIEKMILSNNSLPTPQPGLLFPSKLEAVTTEQEEFGKGFEEALRGLHNSKNSQTNPNTAKSSKVLTLPTAPTIIAAGTGMSGGSITYANMDSFPAAIKDEPQTSNSQPVSPIDMESQEKIKLERKRERNRVAASKCRRRKLERISELEIKVRELNATNSELAKVLKELKNNVANLKQNIIEHVKVGCDIALICNTSSALHSK